MDSQECLELLRGVRDCAFATIDREGLPAVRIIDVMVVEERRLYFCTARGKDFYEELMANPAVAVTGLNKEWQTVRLMGRAERIADAEQHAMIDRIFDENPAMNDVYPGEARYILEAFVIAAGRIEFFDLGKTPISRASLSLGGHCAKKRAFSSRRTVSAAGHVRLSARSSALRRECRMLSVRHIVCTAGCAMRVVLYRQSNTWREGYPSMGK